MPTATEEVREILRRKDYVAARDMFILTKDKSVPFYMRAWLKNQWKRQTKREAHDYVQTRLRSYS